MKKILCLFFFALCYWSPPASPENKYLHGICREALRQHFQGSTPPETTERRQKSRPLFVTLKKGETTRGCAGTFHPGLSTMEEELAYFAVTAAARDFRYPAVAAEELGDIVIIITFPGVPRAAASIAEYNPWEHGLLVRKNGKEGVILPCEGKTSSYSIKKALAQAGIDSIEGADIYIFKCETLTEKKQ